MNKQEYLFECLQEECSEMIECLSNLSKRCSKIKRFGLQEIQPGQNKTNLERLEIELNKFVDESIDFAGVLKFMIKENILPEGFGNGPDLSEKVTLKIEKIKKYMEYSKEQGCLNA